LRVEEDIRCDDERADAPLLDCGECLLDFALIARSHNLQPLTDGTGRGFGPLVLGCAEWVGRVDQDRDGGIVAQDLTYKIKPLGRKRASNAGHASYISAGSVKACYKSLAIENTTGMAGVTLTEAVLAARAAAVPSARMTVTRRATNSAANAGNRS
jgi:hypothetical protein